MQWIRNDFDSFVSVRFAIQLYLLDRNSNVGIPVDRLIKGFCNAIFLCPKPDSSKKLIREKKGKKM